MKTNEAQATRLSALVDQLDALRREVFEAQQGESAPETAMVREARHLLAEAQTLLERAAKAS